MAVDTGARDTATSASEGRLKTGVGFRKQKVKSLMHKHRDGQGGPGAPVMNLPGMGGAGMLPPPTMAGPMGSGAPSGGMGGLPPSLGVQAPGAPSAMPGMAPTSPLSQLPLSGMPASIMKPSSAMPTSPLSALPKLPAKGGTFGKTLGHGLHGLKSPKGMPGLKGAKSGKKSSLKAMLKQPKVSLKLPKPTTPII